ASQREGLNVLAELALLPAAQISTVFGGLGIGTVPRENLELLSAPGPRNQIPCLLLNGCCGLAFGGEENLLQEDLFLTLEFVFVLVVVLLDFGLGDIDAAGYFLPDHALDERPVAHLVLEVFERRPHLLTDPLLELFRVRYLSKALNLGYPPRDFRLDI